MMKLRSFLAGLVAGTLLSAATSQEIPVPVQPPVSFDNMLSGPIRLGLSYPKDRLELPHVVLWEAAAPVVKVRFDVTDHRVMIYAENLGQRPLGMGIKSEDD